MSRDRDLARALWECFFDFECADATKLETLVHYVRKQVRRVVKMHVVRRVRK